MRTVAVILFALFVAGAGAATHMAGGGKIDLSFVPGLEGVALDFGWIEERGADMGEPTASSPATPEDDPPAGAGSQAAAGTGATLAAPAGDGASAPQAVADESALNDLEPAAGPVQLAQADAPSDARLYDVPGRAEAQAAGPDGAPPVFAMPLVCRPGIDCFVQSLVDMAAGEAYRDHTCGALSYNEHKGTDLRLPSHVEMERGYPVVAAAPGVVVAVRDGMPDANYNLFGRPAVNDRGLGNVVAIDHGQGWRTFYGHMRRGSLRVAQGQQVEAGQALGLVGMSGLTEFPHLHFQIMKDDRPIDPYTGLGLESGCGVEGTSLWAAGAREAVRYPRTMLLRLGFSDQVLNKPAVEYMLFKRDGVPANNRALILHAHLTGLLEGDRIEVRIFGPDGDVFAQAGVDVEEAAQSRILRVGKKDLPAPPAAGLYRGELRYMRAGDGGPVELFQASETVAVE